MKPKILLVDDREDNLLSMETVLGEAGYGFVKATSGRQALKILLSEFDFALILMDVQMPGLNGFETATLIYERERLKHIPIIFITAHSFGDENIYKGYRTGAVDYVYKPVNSDLLRAKVSVFVDLYQKNHQLLVQEQKLKAINKTLEAEINERKLSEEKIKVLNLDLLKNIDKLEETNKDLDRFAFMASHDLQEPLRKIHMFSDRLNSKFGQVIGEEGLLYIQRIQNASARLRNLIKSILTLSSISTQKGTFVLTDINLIIQDVLSDLDEMVKAKNAQIKIEKLPVLEVNPALMSILFFNLISNAIKYSRENVDPCVRIYSEYYSGVNSNSEYYRILVEDNGMGFQQQYAEEVFSMFTRFHHDKQVEGTGIGLALCKKIMEEHAGYISAKSNIGVGSVFTVSLPLNVNHNGELEKVDIIKPRVQNIS